MDLQNFIQHWLQAWTGNQPDMVLWYYDEAVFYADPAKPSGIKGKAALKNYLEKLLAKNPKWIWTVVEIIPTEHGCTLKWKAEIPVGNEVVVLQGLDIVEIKNGKILRNEVFFDRQPWLDVLRAQGLL